MAYDKLFDPSSAAGPDLSTRGFRLGDQVLRSNYVYNPDIVLAVNVALATGRPLLIEGEAGTGKSSLAADVASRLGWRFYSKTISSRTQARDLLWSFDTIRRLSDAQTDKGVRNAAAYVEPGVLWWAFDHESAGRRGLSDQQLSAINAASGADRKVEPARYPTRHETSARAVVLIDEIDKADPDVPNDLLEPLGAFRFRVVEGALDTEVAARQAPLVFITTNNERDLPKAFLRRCVHLEIAPLTPADGRLLEIAAAHFPDDAKDAAGQVPLHAEVAKHYFEERDLARGRKPSTAEYLDAVSACRELGLTPGTDAWAEHWPKISQVTLAKHAGN